MANKKELPVQGAEKIEQMPAPETPEKEISKETEEEEGRVKREFRPIEEIENEMEVAGSATAAVTPAAKSPELREIENILEEDLEEFYFELPPEKQKEFKQKGEETASKIEEMLRSVKVNAKKVVNLIKNWLKIIPGVNKFFLEQESKIKADKILKIKK